MLDAGRHPPYRFDASMNASNFPFSVRTFIPISWDVAGISGTSSLRTRESASVGQAVTQRPQPISKVSFSQRFRKASISPASQRSHASTPSPVRQERGRMRIPGLRRIALSRRASGSKSDPSR